mmetsp:Transcript_12688/g.36453  ORF Transcript_12688/g.36453 Transcript_12688/m.36453 type:complete len:307 (-) Transcript_12688:388-1308(-)
MIVSTTVSSRTSSGVSSRPSWTRPQHSARSSLQANCSSSATTSSGPPLRMRWHCSSTGRRPSCVSVGTGAAAGAGGGGAGAARFLRFLAAASFDLRPASSTSEWKSAVLGSMGSEVSAEEFSSKIASSALATSAMLGRSTTAAAVQRSMISLQAGVGGDVAGHLMAATWFLRNAFITAERERPSSGESSHRTKNMIRPKEKTSDFMHGRLLRIASGGIQNNDPPKVFVCRVSLHDRPKSTSFARGPEACRSTMMLQGLRSPCTMPGLNECRYCKARQMPMRIPNFDGSSGLVEDASPWGVGAPRSM